MIDRRLYRAIYCLLLLLLAQGREPTYGQAADKRLSATTMDTARIMKDLRAAYTLQSDDIDSADVMLMKSLEESKALGFKRGAFNALNAMAYGHHFRGNSKAALTYYFRALAYANNEINLSAAYNNIGLSYANMGRYKYALDYYQKALAIHKAAGRQNYKDSIISYINIGILWAKLEEYQQAMESIKKAPEIAERAKDTSILTHIYHNLGAVAASSYRWHDAEEYLKLALKHGTKATRTTQVATLNALATVAMEQEKYSESLNYIQQARAIIDSYQISASSKLYTQAVLGTIYLRMKDTDKAEKTLIPAFKKAMAFNNTSLVQSTQSDVASLYAMIGQYGEAYKLLQDYSLLRDSQMKSEKSLLLRDWANIKSTEADQTILTQKLHITKQEHQLQQKKYLAGGAILGFLLILSISIALMYNNKHKLAISRSMMLRLEQIDEINKLKAQIRGENLERQRIARDLHDDIAGQLWAIKLNVERIEEKGASNLITENQTLTTVFDQLTNVTEDVRKTAHNLMPGLLWEQGLVTAITSLCEKTSNNTSIKVDFRGSGMIPSIDKEIELSIYRMVQELIQNVVKYASNATRALVQINCVDTLLTVTIEDDGIITITEDKNAQENKALQGIRDRVSVLKGRFDLIPGQHNGNTAHLEFDLRHLS